MLDPIVAAVREAGEAALAVYRRHLDTGCAVQTKGDGSPLTEADLLVDRMLVPALRAIAPDIPVVTEERAESHDVSAPRFFLVDPIDGTKEFIRGTDEWTVNVGLVEDGLPTLGVIAAPALGRLFAGDASGAWEERDGERTPLRVCEPRPAPACVASRSHRTPETDAFLEANGAGEIVAAGSSLKFCLVASGEADLYPRLGPTMEWDTAAGDAILRAAGGRVRALVEGQLGPMTYGKAGWRNPDFIADGGCESRLAA